ncbi:OLC1v1008053C1 [Oldenlandia corymbosa var. corymbosa]|uniref:OLC1v1008053C1 n=1 Tax=Oldenlandia corymbosa var. corymbosa TaxID=529605 RepID=A0AAV1DNJ4_OLDCO|nr:OLC1v1008053C1 [Oldenlandia corymbosa var. corymbosa]
MTADPRNKKQDNSLSQTIDLTECLDSEDGYAYDYGSFIWNEKNCSIEVVVDESVISNVEKLTCVNRDDDCINANDNCQEISYLLGTTTLDGCGCHEFGIIIDVVDVIGDRNSVAKMACWLNSFFIDPGELRNWNRPWELIIYGLRGGTEIYSVFDDDECLHVNHESIETGKNGISDLWSLNTSTECGFDKMVLNITSEGHTCWYEVVTCFRGSTSIAGIGQFQHVRDPVDPACCSGLGNVGICIELGKEALLEGLQKLLNVLSTELERSNSDAENVDLENKTSYESWVQEAKFKLGVMFIKCHSDKRNSTMWCGQTKSPKVEFFELQWEVNVIVDDSEKKGKCSLAFAIGGDRNINNDMMREKLSKMSEK